MDVSTKVWHCVLLKTAGTYNEKNTTVRVANTIQTPAAQWFKLG